MPRAEAGSLKSLNNKMKAKGLQRLRWYCQVCEKQCRDENGFKCHTQSESHVRQMLVIGDNAKQFIADYSGQFQRDFVQLLRTGHGEKKINANHFYQEYIANKEHVHMNATRWISLSEFVKHLGREGVCRVEEGEKGLFVSWVDSSPEAMQRQEAVRRKERQDRGDEEREQRAIREQVERARRDAEGAGRDLATEEEERVLRRGEEGEKIKLSFGARKVVPVEPAAAGKGGEDEPEKVTEYTTATLEEAPPPPPPKVSLKMAAAGKPKNVFAAKKKDAKKETKKKEAAAAAAPERPMSAAERIMREDMARKRLRGGPGPGPEGPRDTKRQRV
ncbi:domain of Kin17 curved DNA-binding protein-domain-containing protein [Morchella snyderi]|nr:domain of Kin17 curved DNA-binding protein-domain-containing protein [Morchella snyderi]